MVHYAAAKTIDASAIGMLLERSRRSDGGDALSEHKATRVGGSVDSRAVVGVDASGDPRAYAQAAWHGPAAPDRPGHWAVEVAVDPDSRDLGLIPDLVRAIRGVLPEGDRVAVWSAEDHVTEGLIRSGYRETRRLLRLSIDLPIEATDDVPVRVRIERFLPGRDDDAWLDLNNVAFAGHPENGALRREDLAERMNRPWFDPAGFLMAWEGRRLVGSCWTKVHDKSIGEIYIIAVHPDAHGRGIGRGLLVSGIGYLEQRRKAATVILYVESDNTHGLHLYRSLGFATESMTRQFEDAPPEGAPPQGSQPNR